MWDDETEYETTTEINHNDESSELSVQIEPKWARELCDKPPRPAVYITLGTDGSEWATNVKLSMIDHYQTDKTGRARMNRSQIYSSSDLYKLKERPLDDELEKLDQYMTDVTNDSEHREELLEEKVEKAGAFKQLITSLSKSDIEVLTDLSHHDR